MHDTWGIPGPTFLAYYLGGIVAVAIIAALHRRVLFRGRPDARVDNLGPQQVAYLNGGDRLAIYAALGGLRAAGAIGTGPERTLAQAGHLPPGATALDTAVHNAAGRGLKARDLPGDHWVASALTQLRDGLEADGLAIGGTALREARLWAIGGAAIVLLGVARLIAGANNGKPVGLLLPCIVLAILVTVPMLKKKGRYATRAAIKAMRGLRTQHAYLSPKESPAYATYGATGAAMGVALFGAASLYEMDPAFAADAEIQRAAAASGTAGGGSCGGGSSCGGGGGCGGGGCGG
jgi:uncharacterized protein (TIGR04222 family)